MSLVILCFFNKNLGVVAYKKLILLFLNMYPIIRNVLFLDYEYINFKYWSRARKYL